MKHPTRIVLFALLILLTAFPSLAASPYSDNAAKAVQLLVQTQNIDGSWGTSDDVKLLCTVEAVTALQALNQRIPAYYWGITWLENHSTPNIDYMARRILALASHGDNLQADLALVQAAQMIAQPGNSGWGLTKYYQGTPLDSAMALLASFQMGVGYTANVQSAISYLKAAQLTGTDKGWPVALESASNPMTTALVIDALVNYQSFDSSLSTYIANGVSSLAANVTTSSPMQLQALTAIAYIKAGYSSNAASLLSSISTQFGSSSYSLDAYTTAVSARALAAAMGTDIENLSDTVDMPDPYLRAAVNAALGKNTMDALTKGDMANLTTLNAAGMGISNLTGLEWAVNLTSADLRNNNITDTSPLNGLPQNPTVQLAGNPGAPPPDMPPGYPETVATPALSLPGLIFTVVVLIATAVIASHRKKGTPLSRTTRNTFMLIIALLLPLQPAGAADKSSEKQKGLDVAQVEQIRKIGQAVLTAKKHAAPDPDLQLLRQQAKALSQAVNSLGRMRTPHISVQSDSTSGITPGKEAAKQQERDNRVRSILNEVRRQRAQVQSASRNDTGERGALKRNAAAKLEELENAVEDILNSRPDERAEKIGKLKERFTNKHLPPTKQPQEIREKTPTFSTIVRHRAEE